MILISIILSSLYFPFLTVSMKNVNNFNISGICGFPGEPISSHHNLDNKLVYNSGTVITYQCLDFRSFKQERTCINGEWSGTPARCSNGIDNDIKRVVVKDCSKNDLIADFNQIKQQNNFDRFLNSFSTERYNEKAFRVKNRTCLRWHLHMTQPSYFQFVRIDFAVVFESVSESNRDPPNVTAFVTTNNSLNECKNDAIKQFKHIFTNKWINYGHKYHYYFNCHTNNMTVPQNVFIVETYTKRPITIDLVRFSVAKVYGIPADPACGLPEISVGVSAVSIIDNQLYELYCDENSFVNTTRISRTQIKCTSDALWIGSYPKCKPQYSCADSNTFKVNSNSEIISVENVFHYNKTLWYAIDGSVVNYCCVGHGSDSFTIKSKKCLKNGKWDKKEPVCNYEDNNDSEVPTARQSINRSINIRQLMPVYGMVAFTSLALIIIAIFGVIFIKRRKERLQYKDPNDANLAQNDCKQKQCEVIGWTDRRPVTQNSYLEESQILYQKEYESEAIYDVPPNSSKAVPINYNYKRYYSKYIASESEPIYDEPKRRVPKPD